MRTELVQYRQYHRFIVSDTGIVWGDGGERKTIYHIPSINKDAIAVRTRSGNSMVFTVDDLIDAAFNGKELSRTCIERVLYIKRVPRKEFRAGAKPLLLIASEVDKDNRLHETLDTREYACPDPDAVHKGHWALQPGHKAD